MSVHQSVLRGVRTINWRIVLILAIGLMATHYLIFSYNAQSPEEEPSELDEATKHSLSNLQPNPNPVLGSDFNSPPLDRVPQRKPPPSLKLPLTIQRPITNIPVELKTMTKNGSGLKVTPVSNKDSQNTEAAGAKGTSSADDSAEFGDADPSDTSLHAQPTETRKGASIENLSKNVMGYSGEEVDKHDKEYVAICLAVKDEAHDLPEWLIHHYHHIGISRFYIMDDGSTPPLSEQKIEYGIPESAITFHYQDRATRGQQMQTIFYNQCNEFWGRNHTWIAYIDVDEFLEVTSTNETFISILKEYENFKEVGALVVNWKVHTSAGLLKRPRSCRKSFTTCVTDTDVSVWGGTDDNHHVKSIVKTNDFNGVINPHRFNLKIGNSVGEHGDIVESVAWRSPITRDRLALHHYAVKSREEFEEKKLRGNGMSDAKGEGFWGHVEDKTLKVACPEMAKYDP